MCKKLEGKTAVITGGTEGIGLVRGSKKLFVKEGAYVFITGPPPERTRRGCEGNRHQRLSGVQR